MKKLLIASGVAVLALTSIVAAQTFSTNLTVGSTGADVVALQTALMNAGFDIPALRAGVAYGYFGSQTQAAVKLYQASKGIPNTGFVGPLTRAALNGGVAVVPSTVVCPVGYTCTPNSTPGTTPVTPVVTTPGVITTPGVEGTLTVTASNIGLPSSVYEGDSMVGVLGLKVEAKTSDIAVQRVKIDLGQSTTIYTKAFSKIYVTDGSTVLAASDLNSSTVVKESDNQYTITLAGMNVVVPKNSSKLLTVKVDVRSSVDTTYRSPAPFTFRLYGNQAVRGVDGAGIDQYSGSNSITRTISISSALTDAAQLTLTTNSGSPLNQLVVARGGSNNDEIDGVKLLTFDIKADKDNIEVTDLVATIKAAGAATASSSYLYDGSTQVGSASLSSSTATFSNISIMIPKGTTKTLSLVVDVRGATSAATTFVGQVLYTGITAENSVGDTVSNNNKSGSATGSNILVRKVGAEVTLSSINISKNTATNNNISTTTSSVTFNLAVKAVGDTLVFGTQSASSTFSFGLYRNGTLTTTFVASSTAFDIPDNADTTSLSTGQAFRIPDGQTVVVPVTFSFDNRTTAGVLLGSTDNYKVGLEGINWATLTTPTSVQSSTFMSGQNAWRSGIVLP